MSVFKAYDDKFLSFVEDCDKKFEEESIINSFMS